MDEQRGGGFERKMFSGNWQCSGCGNPITELPFQPNENRLDQLRCRDCYKKSAGPRPERKMFTGNWPCGTCGNMITELPFEPDPSRVGQLKCRDCHRKGLA